MGDIDFVFPRLNQYIHLLEETLEYTKNFVLFVPRKILQTALNYPVTTLVFSVAAVIGFFPFFLFASFAVVSTGFILLHVLVVQGIAGFIVLAGFSGVLLFVMPFTGAVVVLLYAVYSFWMSVYNIYSYVANLITSLRLFIPFFFNALKKR